MKSIKKTILAAFLAISTLGMMTSCNSDVDPIEFTPQYILAVNVSDLIRNGLFNIFTYEEAISTKIANKDAATLNNPALEFITDDVSSDTTGWKWKFDLAEEQIFLKGTMTVTFNGQLLDDGVTKTIDCSQITINDNAGNSLKFFGTVEVTNNSTNATETSRNVITNQFGWGKTNNEVYLNAYYTFESKYSNGTMTECKISGNASGNHVTYGIFSQDIISDLSVSQNYFFTSGSMTLIVPEFGGLALPVDVIFTANSINVTYNGETYTY
ncbi:MAG: hypothetical protein LBS69_10015 [Prevotellaceae bacterium]|jgi:hypothetical protein|nr:hypothetical protein [Prevotellaceae bacterium]